MLDMRTVILSYIISNALITVFIALLWWQNRRQYAGLAFWLADYLLQVFGLGLNALREVLPAVEALILGNTLIVGGIFILYVGLERFVGKLRSEIHNYILLAAFIGLMAYFTFVQPNLSIRTDLVSIAILLLTAQCSVLLLYRVEARLKPVTRYVGLIFVGYALMAMARIILGRLEPLSPTGNWFRAPGGQTLVMLVFQMLNIALTFALILMVTRRLWWDEETQKAERQRAETALRASEARQSAVFRASPIGITLTHLPEGRIDDVNDAFLTMLGYRREEVLGRLTTELGIWVSLSTRERLIEEAGAGGSIRDLETQFRRSSGETLDVLLAAEMIEVQGGRYMITLASDITERKREEQEREQLINQLQETLAHVKTLRGLIPICASCKRIRDDQGYWHQVEVYVQEHSEAQFSHGLCLDCARKLYPDIFEDESGATETQGGKR